MNVAITGVGGGVGQSVIRALRLSGLQLHLIGLDADPWSAGLYQCDDFAVIPMVSEEEAYLRALARIAADYDVEALIPGTDTELPVIAHHQARLRAAGCIPIISAPAVVDMVRDKLRCYTTLTSAGIPFAHTLSAAAFSQARRGVKYPVIIKPRQGSGSVGARVLTRPEEAVGSQVTEEEVVQEYLVPQAWALTQARPADLMKGTRLRQEDEISMQGLVAPDGALVGVFASINELRDGVPMRIRPVCDSDLLAFTEQTIETLAAMGHVGPCNLQGRITARGIVLYEANARFTGITAVRAAFGWNECEAALRLFVLGERPAAVAPSLSYDEHWVCARYVTEQVFPRTAMERSAYLPQPRAA